MTEEDGRLLCSRPRLSDLDYKHLDCLTVDSDGGTRVAQRTSSCFLKSAFDSEVKRHFLCIHQSISLFSDVKMCPTGLDGSD